MASVLSNYFGDLVLQAHLITTPSWLALFTADPTVTGSQVNEVTGGSYARLPCVWTTPGSKTTALGQLRFLNMPACTVTNYAVCDALAGGNILVVGDFAPSLLVTASSELRLPANAIVITV